MTNAQAYNTPAVKIANFAAYLETPDGFAAMLVSRKDLHMSEIAATNLVFAAWLSSETTPETETETETENPEWENQK